MTQDPQSSILIVEDDLVICDLMKHRLERDGFNVTVLHEGRKLFSTLTQQTIDLVILDLGLPDCKGIDLCREVTSTHGIATIIVTARGSTSERIRGLELGADDYISKPFDPGELVARVRTVLRRTLRRDVPATGALLILSFGDWSFDTARRALISNKGRFIMLSTSEFRLMKLFVEHAGEIMKREVLLDLLGEPHTLDRAVDLQVSRLRQKLSRVCNAGNVISTIRNVGYQFNAKATSR